MEEFNTLADRRSRCKTNNDEGIENVSHAWMNMGIKLGKIKVGGHNPLLNGP